MADKVQDLSKFDAFDSAIYSDRLQETRTATGALPPVQVFDKTKPASIVPFVAYVRDKVYSRVQALIDFTGAHEVRLNTHADRLNVHDSRIDVLEAWKAAGGGGVAAPFLADS
jgi:hypothetical protein